MVTVKRLHCSGRKTTMMYGDNTIYYLIISEVISDPKERSHS